MIGAVSQLNFLQLNNISLFLIDIFEKATLALLYRGERC